MDFWDIHKLINNYQKQPNKISIISQRSNYALSSYQISGIYFYTESYLFFHGRPAPLHWVRYFGSSKMGRLNIRGCQIILLCRIDASFVDAFRLILCWQGTPAKLNLWLMRFSVNLIPQLPRTPESRNPPRF
jgi:hypothetical protein